ncbi:MAG TPA: Maf family protein [Solirubrobacteraceae bacterium]|nr:Maf family protein [Solirubrobacteraceae bacterium]
MAERGGEETARARLVLASASPQRRAILESLGLDFTVRPAHVDELERGDAAQVALHNALQKARAGGAHVNSAPAAHDVVLGCDTVVWLDGQIHGKPADERAARATLRALSGNTHIVVSGVAVLGAGEPRTAVARTAVTFRWLSDELLDWYLSSAEWRGRAGGYAIQGAGAALVRSVDGDFYNVVGLPLVSLLDIYPQLLSFHREAPDVR